MGKKTYREPKESDSSRREVKTMPKWKTRSSIWTETETETEHWALKKRWSSLIKLWALLV